MPRAVVRVVREKGELADLKNVRDNIERCVNCGTNSSVRFKLLG